ncbi:hypothetical protein NUW54_g13667 [Trametes sanguinea]|uniref:Uncharacterized protein n=1 Tax=Trametes sanguinea TaxID=158606 RepID=A0ACC1MJV2_9APHY|nr:hypothetical protein NUW54_g13667 [Trametes sanguinea]
MRNGVRARARAGSLPHGWPSRTPSGSPLPTPTSSQIRIQEPPKPRSRKVSQTAHDNVDMMDGTDPWGTNWHHQSPYDIQSNDRRAEPPSPVGARPRRQSMTNGIRHKTVTPSPLSQSTSAVHLHVLDPADIQLPRKLSKRRKPFTHLFGSGNDDDDNTQAKALRPLRAESQEGKRPRASGQEIQRDAEDGQACAKRQYSRLAALCQCR